MSPTSPRSTPRPRVLSGMRPTGRLHLGNYMGALYNWVHLQQDYDCYFFIADFHALTTDYADPGDVQANTIEITLDFLAAGLDPGRCGIFKQSDGPAHSELFLLFSMFTPLGWLERVPTYKDQQEQMREKDLATYGFLGYPLLQAADILLYKPDFVPVGADQVAHVELTRGNHLDHFARMAQLAFDPRGDSVRRERAGCVGVDRQRGNVEARESEADLRQRLLRAVGETKSLAGHSLCSDLYLMPASMSGCARLVSIDTPYAARPIFLITSSGKCAYFCKNCP